MLIDKIYTGQKFKNYKELCAVLGLEVKASANSKNSQIKEISRYCKLDKMGHTYTVEEVFATPLPKVENRGKNKNSHNNSTVLYGNIIQLLVLDLLAQCDDGNLSISRSRLLHTINMINGNYSKLGEQTKKLSTYTEIEESIIYDFYNTSNSNFKKTVETALKSLSDKRKIWFDVVTKVTEIGSFKSRIATHGKRYHP